MTLSNTYFIRSLNLTSAFTHVIIKLSAGHINGIIMKKKTSVYAHPIDMRIPYTK